MSFRKYYSIIWDNISQLPDSLVCGNSHSTTLIHRYLFCAQFFSDTSRVRGRKKLVQISPKIPEIMWPRVPSHEVKIHDTLLCKMAADYSNVKVYTVNGATAGSSSSLPDWLTHKRAAAGRGKRAVREQVKGNIELIQGFDFPEASNRIKTTRDGHHVIATGTYKPRIRVWDLDQLTLKFERHSDTENVDFVVRELFLLAPQIVILCAYLTEIEKYLVSIWRLDKVSTPTKRPKCRTPYPRRLPLSYTNTSFWSFTGLPFPILWHLPLCLRERDISIKSRTRAVPETTSAGSWRKWWKNTWCKCHRH